MTGKDLKNKAMQIKGKDYVLVKDRVLFFNETYEKGYIQTSLVSDLTSPYVVIKAKVVPDSENPERYFTGYSQEKVGEGMINKTSALENAETSAVGRALAMMGIGVIESIASVDEINKAQGQQARSTPTTPKKRVAAQSAGFAECQVQGCKKRANLKWGKDCYDCKEMLKQGMVPPNGVAPDTPDGQPFA